MAAVLLAGSALSAAALDLPVRRINGSDQYYYEVRHGDTVYGLAKKLGISRDEIVRFNPSAADGLREGSTLYFPVKKFADKGGAPATPTQGDETLFRYKVKRGETLFGLSHRFGVSPERLVELNPSSNDGIKAGEYLLIPVKGETAPESADLTPLPTPAPTPAPAPAPAPEPAPIAAPVPAPAPVPVPEDPVVEADVESVTLAGSVAVLLPLMLDEAQPGKVALRSSDFVKGLMLAAREMGAGGLPVKIKVYDTKGSRDEVARLMGDPDISDADVIISPEDEQTLAAILSKATEDAYIFNILAVQDTAYMTHDNVLQANIPHDRMYETAMRGLLETYAGYTPVFLICKGGRSEKIGFTNYAREEFARQGIAPVDLTFEGMLTQRELEGLDPTGKYVFIPASGSLSEFNKFGKALRTFRENAADPHSVALFGYPDWTIFRNDAAEALHELEATFYSRFYADEQSDQVREFNRSFTSAFGSEPMSVVPSQAMLGYDAARFIITDIRENKGVFSPEIPSSYVGLQSAFRFEEASVASDGGEPENESGPVNTALYLITYLPGNGVVSRVL